MSNNDWVQQGTPRDDRWTAEDDYGVPVEPAEWDDYASEQTVPVPPAPAQAEPGEEGLAPTQPTPPADDESGWRTDEVAAGEAHEEQGAVVADDREGDEHASLPADQEVEHDQPTEEWRPIDQAPVDDTTQPDHDADRRDDDTAVADADRLDDDTALADADRRDVEAAGAPASGAVPLAAGAAGGAAMAGLYRGETDQERTQVIDSAQHQRLADELAEEERLAEQLRADRQARAQRLGLVATSDENAVREAPARRYRGVGHFGSFGLFVLRLVTAAILGVVGYQILSDVDATTEFLGRTLIPEPQTVAWALGFGLAAMAVLLVVGLGVRVVGVLLALVAGGSLALIRWGQFSPFVDGMEGFLGDLDLLLLAVGIVFLSLGGGRWGIDGAFAKARENSRDGRV